MTPLSKQGFFFQNARRVAKCSMAVKDYLGQPKEELARKFVVAP